MKVKINSSFCRKILFAGKGPMILRVKRKTTIRELAEIVQKGKRLFLLEFFQSREELFLLVNQEMINLAEAKKSGFLEVDFFVELE